MNNEETPADIARRVLDEDAAPVEQAAQLRAAWTTVGECLDAYRSDAPALARAYLALEADNAVLLRVVEAGIVYWNCNFNNHVAECVGRCSEQFASAVEHARSEHPGEALLRELAVLRLLADAAKTLAERNIMSVSPEGYGGISGMWECVECKCVRASGWGECKDYHECTTCEVLAALEAQP